MASHANGDLRCLALPAPRPLWPPPSSVGYGHLLAVDQAADLKVFDGVTDTGQQKAYVVLSDKERAKGCVRPFREAYRRFPAPAC